MAAWSKTHETNDSHIAHTLDTYKTELECVQPNADDLFEPVEYTATVRFGGASFRKPHNGHRPV